MAGQRRWWSGHELYGLQPQEYRFRESFYQEAPYIDLSPQNDEEMQLAYWKSLYPEKAKRVQQMVEETCEAMEYTDSPMYDEYPDKVYLRKLGNDIYNQLIEEDGEMEEMGDELESEEMPYDRRMPQSGPGQRHQRPPMQPGPRPPRNPWLRDMVDVLLFQEMHRRRCERGRCRRRWY